MAATDMVAPPPPAFVYTRLAASFLSFSAGLVLLADVVVLAIDFRHIRDIQWCFYAGALVAAAGFINMVSLCFVADPQNRGAACYAFRWDLLFLMNIVALDGFLFEEETYNHWGHPENVLREERNFGACLEVAVAAGIFMTITKQYVKEKKPVLKLAKGNKAKGKGMV
jgi:hypothetical protein